MDFTVDGGDCVVCGHAYCACVSPDYQKASGRGVVVRRPSMLPPTAVVVSVQTSGQDGGRRNG